ncbi:putative NBD/HSP70 family sugar kinase [Nonomuraea polychroma]|uniref:Putative NBD/HSP70 family sugar kinase n=1 Tax=Nonomuraea polychroma TaxID=46176 RepID=A0A438M2P8_9ACTN|nr:ROK family protein [Nonomuraea polychroma]RVX39877.1 putative NBD/HSP70 family sugar kinase [Nonomuraea polychroma]
MTESTLVDTGGSATGAGVLLSILRDGRPRTRAELVQLTGWARSTLSLRLDALLNQRLVAPTDDAMHSGGRPATTFAFNQSARVVLAADLGVTHARLAVTDLATTVLAERSAEMPIDRGPVPVLTWLVESFHELLGECGRGIADVCGIGVGLPGPVEHDTGKPVNPPIMPGWDRFAVPEWLSARLGAPVLVDNDVNIMALGEYWAVRSQVKHMIFVKIGTGVGCGIISEGRLHRGAQGAAGDIGHIRVPSFEDVVCRCGNTGCLEAVAGGGALAARLRAAGEDTSVSRDVVERVRAGNVPAIQAVRQAGREIGTVLASVVSFFNPSLVVIGGDIAEAGEHLLAGVREVVYSRSLPLATQHLGILASELGDRAGITGAAVMVLEHVLAPEAVDQAVMAVSGG